MVRVTSSDDQVNLMEKSPEASKITDSGGLTTPLTSTPLHNFKSMEELLRGKYSGKTDPTDDRKPNDENENSVQDLRMNGHRRGREQGDGEQTAAGHHGERRDNGYREYKMDVSYEETRTVDIDGDSESLINSDLSSVEGEEESPDNFLRRSNLAPKERLRGYDDAADEFDEELLEKVSSGSECETASEIEHNDVRRSKRKQYRPVQRDVGRDLSMERPRKLHKLDTGALLQELAVVKRQVQAVQELQARYMFAPPHKTDMNRTMASLPDSKVLGSAVYEDAVDILDAPPTLEKIKTDTFMNELADKDSARNTRGPDYLLNKDSVSNIESLSKQLKEDLCQQIGHAVDSFLHKVQSKVPRTPKDSVPRKESLVEPVSTANAADRCDVIKDCRNTNVSFPSPRSTSDYLHPSPMNKTSPFDFKSHFPFFQRQAPKFDADKPENCAGKIEIPKPHKPKITDKIFPHYFDPSRSFADFPRPLPWAFPHLPGMYHSPQLPHPPPHSIHAAFVGIMANKEQEQNDPLPLVVNSPKKKRTKVTDTRLSPRAARALLQEPVPAELPLQCGMDRKDSSCNFSGMSGSIHRDGYNQSMIPSTLPTSVAIPNPSLQQSHVFGMFSGSKDPYYPRDGSMCLPGPSRSPPNLGGGGSDDESLSPSGLNNCSPSDSPSPYSRSEFDRLADDSSQMDACGQTSTLTPMHLRKAKLMFFYVRYPSSSILKVFFPDVKFNKNNTAQLVKWFSNFREFFYIQMEKYSRQALAEGVKVAEELIVTTDSELYRVLNLHYNRNNQLEVPENFRIVVQATLREFFKAISVGKDQEQSWKKPIYKIIARMDDCIPDYFKSPNWVEQLNDL